MREIIFLIIIFLIIVITYNITDNNVNSYNDYKYFKRFKNTKVITKLKHHNKLIIPDTRKNNILLITYDNRPNLPYIKIHNENMKKYCQKWGFKYIFKTKCDYNNYWCKIYLVLSALNSNKYDYVMWLDSDTYIFNMNINLSDVFNKYSSHIFIGSDNNKKYDLTNAGVFAIKNSQIGKEFLLDCLNSFNKNCLKQNGQLKGSWAATCYEQGIMNILIADKYFDYTTVLTNDLIFNYNKCNNNVFIMHLYASSDNYRKKCFTSKKLLY